MITFLSGIMLLLRKNEGGYMQKAELIGERFGMLTVIEKTKETQDRYALWRCKCDCGGEIYANTKRLKRGTITNCGCIPKNTVGKGSIAEDLSGQVFGSLTVLERAENRNGRVAWKCRCKCGNEKVVSAHELKKKTTQYCGTSCTCKQYPFVDLKGFTSGFLRVLEKTDQRDKKGSIIWRCICLRCGKECFYSADALVNHRNVSCGCYREEVIAPNIVEKLRFVDGTCVDLLKYRKKRCDNTSGFRGVSRMPNGRYRAHIGFKGKRYYIGTYSTFDEAVQHRLEVETLIHDAFVEQYERWEMLAKLDPEWAKINPLVFEVEKIDGAFIVTSTEYNCKNALLQNKGHNIIGGQLK